MNDDEVRDLFSPYHDGELARDEHDRVRAALEANPALAKEYESFAAMLKDLSNLAVPASPEGAPPALHAKKPDAPVDLLEGVQKRLHARSKGKFYRDRWSRAAGIFPLEVIAALVLVALVVAYFAMTAISIEPAQAPQPSAPSAPSR